MVDNESLSQSFPLWEEQESNLKTVLTESMHWGACGLYPSDADQNFHTLDLPMTSYLNVDILIYETGIHIGMYIYACIYLMLHIIYI